MTKIEPMTVATAKQIVSELRHCFTDSYSNPEHRLMLSVILAWAHERAEKNESNFLLVHYDCTFDDCRLLDKRKHQFGPADWRNEVLNEIGFPEDMQ